jgi:hypothetical protein
MYGIIFLLMFTVQALQELNKYYILKYTNNVITSIK